MLILDKDYEHIEGLYSTEKSWGELLEDFFKESLQKLFVSHLGDLSSKNFGDSPRILANNFPLGPVEGRKNLTVISSSSIDWRDKKTPPLGLVINFRDFVKGVCVHLDFEMLQ